MPTRTIAGDADAVEVSALLWQATGCLEGASPAEGGALTAEYPLREMGTPGLLTGLWEGAQAQVAGDRGPRLQAREIAAVHDALVAAWRRRGDVVGAARGSFPRTRASTGRSSLGGAGVCKG